MALLHRIMGKISRLWLYYKTVLTEKKPAPEKEKIVIYTKQLRGRYLHFLAFLLKDHFEVYYGLNHKNISHYHSSLFNELTLAATDFIRARSWPLKRKEDYRLITDNKQTFQTDNGWKSKHYLDYNYFSDKEGYKIPYGMFIYNYSGLTGEKIRSLRLKEKKIKVLFAGAAGPGVYENEIFKDVFNILNRNELYQELINIAQTGKYTVATTPGELLTGIRNDETIDLAILVNTADTYHRLHEDQWMSILAQSDFFIAAPGVIMPFSHNMIESLSVGCIPVTQYGHLLTPDLDHFKAGVSFQSIEEFRKVIEECISMPYQAIQTLKMNAEKYYDQFLDPSVISNNLAKHIHNNQPTLIINGEQESVDAYLKEIGSQSSYLKK